MSLPHTTRSLILEVTGVGRTFSSQFQYEFALLGKNGNEEKKIQNDPQFPVEGLQSSLYDSRARDQPGPGLFPPLNVQLRIQSAPFLGSRAVGDAPRRRGRGGGSGVPPTVPPGVGQSRLEKTNIELTETRLRLANETEAERSRIARDLHDQTLADLRHLLVMTDQLPGANSSSTTPDDSTPSPSALRREIEDLQRDSPHLRRPQPVGARKHRIPARARMGLEQRRGATARRREIRLRIQCEPNLEDRLRLSHIERIQLYRMIQEALNNVCPTPRRSM